MGVALFCASHHSVSDDGLYIASNLDCLSVSVTTESLYSDDQLPHCNSSPCSTLKESNFHPKVNCALSLIATFAGVVS